MPDINTQTVLANVRAEMARGRMRQTALAEHLGVSTGTISALLSGQYRLTVDRLIAIADVLDVPPATLLGGAA